MTEKEKLREIKELADAMYYTAQQMTTDASRLHGAMEKYRQFVINEYNKEEPVSEELEEMGMNWLRPQLDKSYANYGETKMMELTHFDGYAMLDAIEFGLACGALWRDEHPRKGLVDIDKVCEFIETHYAEYMDFDNFNCNLFVYNLRKAMEE